MSEDTFVPTGLIQLAFDENDELRISTGGRFSDGDKPSWPRVVMALQRAVTLFSNNMPLGGTVSPILPPTGQERSRLKL